METYIGTAGDDSEYIYGGSGEDIVVDAGAGNDDIDVETYGGSAVVSGGDGDDNIRVYADADETYVDDPDTGYGDWVSSGGDATITGGAGSDHISVSGYGGDITVDAGDDDDTITVNAAHITVTTGAGSDTIVLNDAYNDGNGRVVTDFDTGSDRIDVEQLAYDLGFYDGEDLFENGSLRIGQRGTDTVILVDSGYDGFQTVLVLANVTAADLGADNFSPAMTPVISLAVSITGSDDDETLIGSDDGDRLDGAGGNDTLDGGAGRDVLDGGDGDDVIYGGAGDDSINGGDGADVIFGGDGNDSISDDTYGGSIVIDAGDGDDNINIYANADSSYVYDPDTGEETYVTVGGDVTIDAGAGNDTIYGGIYGGSAVIDAGDGDDLISLYGGFDATLTGGAGEDRFEIESFSIYNASNIEITDFEAGAAGDVFDISGVIDDLDSIGWTGGNPFGTGHLALVPVGADTVLTAFEDGDSAGEAYVLVTFRNTAPDDFEDGNFDPAFPLDGSVIPGQTLTGTTDDDYLQGGVSDDTLIGDDGYDELEGSAGNDALYGGDGDDYLYGGIGNDTLDGGAGDDYLYDNSGDNTLLGGDGDDDIYAYGDGNIVVDAGAGNDDIDIETYGGTAVVAGGDGDDNIRVYANADETYVDDPDTGYGDWVSSGGDATITGGAGSDRISVSSYGGVITVDAGDGDDAIEAFGNGDLTLTGGLGADEIRIGDISPYGNRSVTITDFETGPAGDRLGLPSFFDNFNETGYNFSIPPFDGGLLTLIQRDSDTVLVAHVDGEMVDLITFADTDATDFTADNFIAFGDPVVEVPATNAEPLGTVTVTGTPIEDAILSADATALTDADGLGPISYQWLRDGAAISGATADTYSLGQADVGATIAVRVSYTDGGGTVETVVSDASEPVANVNDAPTGGVTISGTAIQNGVLTAQTGTLADADGLGVLSYDWRINGASATNVTGATYTLTQAEVGATVSVNVSYTDGQGTLEIVASGATTVVSNVNDPVTGQVTISGTFEVGQTLMASPVLTDPDGLGDVNLQWLRDGVAIDDATGESYTLTNADSGADIAVRASYVDGFGTLETLTSNATTVAVANAAPTGSVTIRGTVAEDQILTADVSTLADANGRGTLSYQWLRDGVAVNRATGATYALGQADVGAAMSVRVSYTDGDGFAEIVTASATQSVQNVDDAPTGGVTVSGTALVGQTLTATSTVRDEDGISSSSLVWLRDGVLVASGASYTLVEADAGASLSAAFSYVDGFGNKASVVSASTDPVVDPNPAPTGGDDTLTGGTGGDVIDGGSGSDSIEGGLGNDSLSGGAGSDVLDGGAGSDILFGGGGNDTSYGGGGRDILDGGGGKDSLFGGGGSDRLDGGGGKDDLQGGAGKDKLYGGSGNDELFGGGGNDKLFGGNGKDDLVGGAGRDILTGGGGADSFIFNGTGESSTGRRGRDVVVDFDGKDILDLSGIDADSGARGNNDFAFSGTSSAANAVWYQDTRTGVIVYGDIDGDGRADFGIELRGIDSLNANDFIL